MPARDFRAQSVAHLRRGAQSAAAMVAVLVLVACGAKSAKPFDAATSPSAAARSIIERVELDERPPLSLLEREGDPLAAVAFVASHARGSAASAALLGLLLGRLEKAGISKLEGRAHSLGLELSQSVEDPEHIEHFMHAVHAALRAEVVALDPALSRAKVELDALRALAFMGTADATAAACSGELGWPDPSGPIDLATPAGIQRIEAARLAIYRTTASAFAALGPKATLGVATNALSDDDDWPTHAADPDPWPSADSIGVDLARGVRHLSLALRVADAEAAAHAGRQLSAPGSELLQRLETLSPPWRLERSVAVARRLGACLRIDLRPPQGDPGPTDAEVARAAVLSQTAISRALENAEPGALDESILTPADPRRAAVLAAWRALPSERHEGATRRTLSYVADPSDRVDGKS